MHQYVSCACFTFPHDLPMSGSSFIAAMFRAIGATWQLSAPRLPSRTCSASVAIPCWRAPCGPKGVIAIVLQRRMAQNMQPGRLPDSVWWWIADGLSARDRASLVSLLPLLSGDTSKDCSLLLSNNPDIRLRHP